MLFERWGQCCLFGFIKVICSLAKHSQILWNVSVFWLNFQSIRFCTQFLVHVHLDMLPTWTRFAPQCNSVCCCRLSPSAPKARGFWLRNRIASGPCSHQGWACPPWTSDWIQMHSTYFCGFNGNQTGDTHRLLTLAISLKYSVFSISYLCFLSRFSLLFFPYGLVLKHF